MVVVDGWSDVVEVGAVAELVVPVLVAVLPQESAAVAMATTIARSLSMVRLPPMPTSEREVPAACSTGSVPLRPPC